SMKVDGTDLQQHTNHKGWDAVTPSMHDGRIVYQQGADLRLLDVRSGEDRLVDIRLPSDFEQRRERWVKDAPKWITAAHPSPDGKRVALTARGMVFIATHGPGRLVQVTRESGVRYRHARFLPDGKTLLAVEFCTLPADGIGEERSLSSDADVFRGAPSPSPDGRRFAWKDKEHRIWIRNIEDGTATMIHEARVSWNLDDPDLRWSPDGRWLAFVDWADNQHVQVLLYGVESKTLDVLTSDRTDSYSPAFSPDGKWLYFISDRHFDSVVRHPWGSRQPDPFFDHTGRIYALSLKSGERFPFQEPDELVEDDKGDGKEKKDKKDGKPGEEGGKKDDGEKKEDKEEKKESPFLDLEPITIDREGLQDRLFVVPVPPGNYERLWCGEKHLYWIRREVTPKRTRDLVAAPIADEDVKVETVMAGIASWEPTMDGKSVMIRKGPSVHIVPANGKPAGKPDKTAVDLSKWIFTVNPVVEWRQVFHEAWRMHRDFYWDKNMHGVDWSAMREKYLPLVDRVTNRGELSDLIGQMLSETSTLHTFVYGGDNREGDDKVDVGSLGVEWDYDAAANVWSIARIYRGDPDYPSERSPLSRPDLGVGAGDIVESVNGVPFTGPDAPGVHLRGKAGLQVRLRIRDAETRKSRDVIAKPLAARAAGNLRYTDWEVRTRESVDTLGDEQIGYVHLRAMGAGDIAAWTRQYYPVFRRKGLILDVRHNRGGNIDSWLLGKLMRKAWYFWSPRKGPTYANMQYAYRGHIIVLCNERTGSDGESFAEGIRRLELGPILGTRTWGGGIWLSSRPWLLDRGFATASETAVYGPEGKWLIEGTGLTPDIIVDNPPRVTFLGKDTQLEAAVDYLRKKIAEDPRDIPPAPPRPDKSFDNK
ncbi:MAG: S41 family peptidase, partial [Planctomycetota bacterium]